MKKDYVFIEYGRILQLNALAIDRYGGTHAVRDYGLIDSAINQPRATFGGEYVHQNIYEMAAAYFYHISQNQGFSDGNKRTGFLAMFAFLKLNGYDLTIPDDYLWPVLMKVANGETDKYALAEFLQNNTTKIN